VPELSLLLGEVGGGGGGMKRGRKVQKGGMRAQVVSITGDGASRGGAKEWGGRERGEE